MLYIYLFICKITLIILEFFFFFFFYMFGWLLLETNNECASSSEPNLVGSQSLEQMFFDIYKRLHD